MDRNVASLSAIVQQTAVATREGGVDRNLYYSRVMRACQQSPPARVAWIETIYAKDSCPLLNVATREGGVDRNIWHHYTVIKHFVVATREGGVDRNLHAGDVHRPGRLSPPARVAWIET